MTTLVMGAGVVGITTAYYLSLAGEAVTVVDRQCEAGVETSFANGGLITPSMSDPWGAPGLPLKLLKWLGSEDAPFLLRARAIPGLLDWGVRFLANCTDSRWRSNAKVVHRLAEHSTNALADISANTGLEYDRSSVGNLRVFRDQHAMEAALKTAGLMSDFGVRHQTLNAQECTELEPALATVSSQLIGGILYPDDDSGDAYKFTQGLARLCELQGVKFSYNSSITRIATDGDNVIGVVTEDGNQLQADHYVLALGSFSPLVAKTLRIHLPVYPVKGYSITIPFSGTNSMPQIPVIDDGRKLGVTPLGNKLRAAGTAEFNGYDVTPNEKRSALLLKALTDLYPHITIPDNVQPWCGLRPVTPDGPPILGHTRLSNLYLNCGHGHLGWTLACGSAKIVTDVITGNTPEIDLQGLTLDRF